MKGGSVPAWILHAFWEVVKKNPTVYIIDQKLPGAQPDHVSSHKQ